MSTSVREVPKAIYHTDKILRQHQLVVKQEGWGLEAKFSLVDWESHRPASKARIEKYCAGGELG